LKKKGRPHNDYLYFANQKAADNIHTDKSRQNTNSDLKTK